MSFGQMLVYSIGIFTLGILWIIGLLPPVDAAARFTQHPPSVLYVQTGKTARFVWDYTVDNRNTEFSLNSPEWGVYDSNNRRAIIGSEDGLNGWKWTISNQCPSRLLNPVRVSKESTATLVITNVITADSGIYECRLVLLTGSSILSKVQLVVTVSPQFNPQPPQTKNIAEGQDLSLPCTAIGPPTPNITWVQVVGHVIKSTGTGSATLKIPNIRRDQNGTYECQAWNNPNEKPVTAQTLVTVQYPPQTTVTPASITAVQGNEIQLSCTATGNPPPSISWTKADDVIKADHTVAGGTLRIPDAIKTDAGRYICTAKNTYDSREHSDTASATVVVKYQPSIIHDKLVNQTVNETESLSIKCDVDGYPTPIIKWKTPSGSVYTAMVYNISSVSRSDAGKYTCTASNGIGREAVARIQVTVQYPPKIDVSTSTSSSKSWNGGNLRLKCYASGLPLPRISWYKPTNQHITTGVNMVPEGSEVTVLTTIDQGDYGQYKCGATNILGSDEHLINVTQLFPPGPIVLMITEIEASSITVKWTKPANDGGSPVTGYLLEISTKPPAITVNTQAIITGLKANTQYTVKVTARNIVNNGQPSIKVITTKKQGKPSLPELNVTLSQILELSVKLIWTKPDENGGEITKYTIYMMEGNASEWTKMDDILDPAVLEYTVTKDLEHGKTYKFIVTAWNKYGESTKYGGVSKEIPEKKSTNGNTSKSNDCSCEKDSKYLAAFGVVTAMLVVSLVLNVLLILYIWKKIGLKYERNAYHKESKQSRQPDDEQISDNEIDSGYSNSKQSRNPVPEYEAVKLQQLPSKQTIIKPTPYEVTCASTNESSHYQELSSAGSAIADETRPVYEHLQTALSRYENETNTYQPLGLTDQNSEYQSLHADSSSSII